MPPLPEIASDEVDPPRDRRLVVVVAKSVDAAEEVGCALVRAAIECCSLHQPLHSLPHHHLPSFHAEAALSGDRWRGGGSLTVDAGRAQQVESGGSLVAAEETPSLQPLHHAANCRALNEEARMAGRPRVQPEDPRLPAARLELADRLLLGGLNSGIVAVTGVGGASSHLGGGVRSDSGSNHKREGE